MRVGRRAYEAHVGLAASGKLGSSLNLGSSLQDDFKNQPHNFILKIK
jgi:hypothetical protein